MNNTTESIQFISDTGWNSGDAVVYQNGGNESVTGLVNGQSYYVITNGENSNSVKLAATRSDALNGNEIDLDASLTSGVHSLNRVSSAGSNITGSTPTSLSISDELGSGTVQSGTTAFIGSNTVVKAGNNISVLADSTIQALVQVGGGTFGLAGISVGASVGVVKLYNRTDAFIGSNANIIAVGDIAITANGSILPSTLNVEAGLKGANVAALGAAYGKFISDNDANAYINSYTNIESATNLLINANTDSNLTVKSDGDLGGLNGLAIGLVTAKAIETGTTQAYLANGVVVGNAALPGQTVDNLSINASANVVTKVDGKASTSGVISGNSVDAEARSNPTIQAYIASGVDIDVSNNVDLNSISYGAATANARGSQTSGIAIGKSDAYAEARPNISTYIGDTAIVQAGNNISLSSTHNYNNLGVPLANKVTAFANSSAGALIGVVGADSDAISASNVNTYIGNSTINAANSISLTSRASDKANSVADGSI